MKKIFKFFLAVTAVIVFVNNTTQENKVDAANENFLSIIPEFYQLESFVSYEKERVSQDARKISISSGSGYLQIELDGLVIGNYYVILLPRYGSSGEDYAGDRQAYQVTQGSRIYHERELGDLYYSDGQYATEDNSLYDFVYCNSGIDFTIYECFIATSKQLTYRTTRPFNPTEFQNFSVLFSFSKTNSLSEQWIAPWNAVNDGDVYTMSFSVNTPPPYYYIVSNVQAKDNKDGDISNNIEVITSYPKDSSYRYLPVGTYPFIFKIKDSSNNTSQIEVRVVLVDYTPPVIIGPDSLTIGTNNDFENIRGIIVKHYTVVDNVDQIESTKIEIDKYPQTIGVHNIKLTVKDTAGRVGTKNITVNIVDGTPPVISGPNIIQTTTPLTDAQILAKFSATDLVDGNVNSKLKVGYNSSEGTKCGEYILIIEATDNNGNLSSKQVIYTIYDDEPPIFYVVSHLVKVSQAHRLSSFDIVKSLLEKNLISQDEEYTITSDYFENYNVPGTYDVHINIKGEDGEYREELLKIEVFESSEVITLEPAEDQNNSVDKKKIVLGASFALSGLAGVVYFFTRKKK